MHGAITGFVTGGVGNRLRGACFVEGTAVLTASGSVAIESIQPGDLVWSWDENTGDVALKEVVCTYENPTRELIHLLVQGEEIVTTPTHPFYSPRKGWIAAIDLQKGDSLVLVHGEYVVVEQIQHELLERAIPVYNLQVQDYHTYYVSNRSVLVHNKCDIKTGGSKKYKICSSRRHAFREAKRYAGIPVRQQPKAVVRNQTRKGMSIPGRTYVYQIGRGREKKIIKIAHHKAGHTFPDGSRMTRHYNVLGSDMHFFY